MGLRDRGASVLYRWAKDLNPTWAFLGRRQDCLVADAWRESREYNLVLAVSPFLFLRDLHLRVALSSFPPFPHRLPLLVSHNRLSTRRSRAVTPVVRLYES